MPCYFASISVKNCRELFTNSTTTKEESLFLHRLHQSPPVSAFVYILWPLLLGWCYLDYQGAYGVWWSISALSSTDAYDLSMGSSTLRPQYNGNKAFGLSLRCITILNNLIAIYSIYNFKKILHSTGSTKARRYPLSYTYSGSYYWGSGNLDAQGAGGSWWSSSASASANAYRLSIPGSVLNPQANNDKMLGLTLRFLSTPPAPPKPAGIRFRIYTPATTTGVMVTCTIRARPATGGLLRQILVPMLTICTWLARSLIRRITIIRQTAFLSVVPHQIIIQSFIKKLIYCFERQKKLQLHRLHQSPPVSAFVYIRWEILLEYRGTILL